MALVIEPFNRATHLRSSFCCGEAALDNYIQRQASQDLKKRMAAVFVLIDSPNVEVLGYYTLSAYTVIVTALQENLGKRLPRYPQLPATLLGRLAVDSAHKGQGLGELLLVDALKKTLETSREIASLAVIVEALNQPARSFYLKYGFIPFQQEPMKLYLPLQSVEGLI
ncbi:GNAT family N-acetyltransferase [Synechocystis salina]|uniref:GNAT family N-acetyltransferase n=1 Tax=Synechocystis salina LEGE 00031 TaxID=1828736 RepID=A0ABR9VWM9_9SYNC|nr:GNAT family N-acetyltransferase [Synechocystis salina]MBE9241211.1 GNAT family N-acetyltransferase [Synechocystis salina LEGE 00041]MBE9255770.1 GNAT family N-acetyltransferase [Synechocystis salina LEGE 00031]